MYRFVNGISKIFRFRSPNVNFFIPLKIIVYCIVWSLMDYANSYIYQPAIVAIRFIYLCLIFF